MRLFLVLCGFLLNSLTGFTQSFQKVPLKKVIAEAQNDFDLFKGELSTTAEDDSFYSSTVTIEGSKTNEISQLAGKLTQYHAYISDSASKKQAKQLVETWRLKIKASCTDYFEETVNSTFQKRITNGYRFSKVIGKELYSISIVCRKRETDPFYWVLLTVTRQGRAVLDDEGGTE
jgi:hypothetical protein